MAKSNKNLHPKNFADVNQDSNPDPLTGEPGSHPIGTGLGSAGGAVAGAAMGVPAGPAGIAVGAVAGAVVGAYAGKGLAEIVNPSDIDEYWSENFADRPYVENYEAYETYRPAYLFGYESRIKYPNKDFNEVEKDISETWQSKNTDQDWNKAREAVRDSYERTDDIYREKIGNS